MTVKISAASKNAFKDADIRGIYPQEINEELVYLIARSFVDEFGLKKVLVARDMRLSSPMLHSAFCKGVTDAGADVLDLGLTDTPLLYFASGSLKEAGVMITASHSPKSYNGLKLVLSGAIPLTEKHGLKAIRRRIEKGVFNEVDRPGKVRMKSLQDAYLKFSLRGIKPKKLAGLKVVLDCGNGMASNAVPFLKAKLPVDFTPLFAELDGNFPNHASDPTLKKNQKEIIKMLKAGNYDFGVAFDGDADRIVFFDERGKYVNSAAVAALITKFILTNNKSTNIVYTNLTSRILAETIKSNRGVANLARVGHAFVKETMRSKDAFFGCEHSGHFYFKENYYTDSALMTLSYVLEIFSTARNQGLTFSQMMAPYTVYEQTEDVIVYTNDSTNALEAVHKYLLKQKPLSIKKYDGYMVDFGDVWGAVKISVTEPALKIMFEAKKLKPAKALQDKIVSVVEMFNKTSQPD